MAISLRWVAADPENLVCLKLSPATALDPGTSPGGIKTQEPSQVRASRCEVIRSVWRDHLWICTIPPRGEATWKAAQHPESRRTKNALTSRMLLKVWRDGPRPNISLSHVPAAQSPRSKRSLKYRNQTLLMPTNSPVAIKIIALKSAQFNARYWITNVAVQQRLLVGGRKIARQMRLTI
jgi:hypothetical protein